MGEYKWPQGEKEETSHKYKGEWVEGKMNGQGEFFHKNGHILKGTFVNNLYLTNYKGRKFFLQPMETK